MVSSEILDYLEENRFVLVENLCFFMINYAEIVGKFMFSLVVRACLKMKTIC